MFWMYCGPQWSCPWYEHKIAVRTAVAHSENAVRVAGDRSRSKPNQTKPVRESQRTGVCPRSPEPGTPGAGGGGGGSRTLLATAVT